MNDSQRMDLERGVVKAEAEAEAEEDEEEFEDEEADMLAYDAADPDWTLAKGFESGIDLYDEEVVEEDDEEDEDMDDDGYSDEEEATSPGALKPRALSSGSQRSAAETEDATGAGERRDFLVPRWGGGVDEDGELRTTTIDFSLSVDLRKMPELLCKSKDRVPLFKVTASGSYNCTRNAFRRAGFKQTKGNNFTVLWGMPLKLPEFKDLKEYQRVNHFPGTYLLGRKDNMARVCMRFRRNFGPENFEYFPKTFVCPSDRAELLADEEECKKNAKKGETPMWIVKPPAGCKGIGIRLVTDPSTQIKEKAVVVVSRYIDRPCLINDTKFDMRLYVVVTSLNPLRIYIHEHGLARFCTVKYSSNSKTRKSRYRHLTNYSLNKNNPNFQRAEGGEDDVGHKWSIAAVWKWFEKNGIKTQPIKDKIDDLIVKTLLAVEPQISTNMQLGVPHRSNCFEIFGFDVILDQDLKPWLVEVNTALSLATDAPLDKKIKNDVVTELLHMLRIQCYNRKKLDARLEKDKCSRLVRKSGSKTSKMATQASGNMRKRDVCMGKAGALENLSLEDVGVLEELEEEYARRGSYRRIFPQDIEQMHTWMNLFEVKRYYNLLQYHWITRRTHTKLAPRELHEQQRGLSHAALTPTSSARRASGVRAAITAAGLGSAEKTSAAARSQGRPPGPFLAMPFELAVRSSSSSSREAGGGGSRSGSGGFPEGASEVQSVERKALTPQGAQRGRAGGGGEGGTAGCWSRSGRGEAEATPQGYMRALLEERDAVAVMLRGDPHPHPHALSNTSAASPHAKDAVRMWQHPGERSPSLRGHPHATSNTYAVSPHAGSNTWQHPHPHADGCSPLSGRGRVWGGEGAGGDVPLAPEEVHAIVNVNFPGGDKGAARSSKALSSLYESQQRCNLLALLVQQYECCPGARTAVRVLPHTHAKRSQVNLQQTAGKGAGGGSSSARQHPHLHAGHPSPLLAAPQTTHTQQAAQQADGEASERLPPLPHNGGGAVTLCCSPHAAHPKHSHPQHPMLPVPPPLASAPPYSQVHWILGRDRARPASPMQGARPTNKGLGMSEDASGVTGGSVPLRQSAAQAASRLPSPREMGGTSSKLRGGGGAVRELVLAGATMMGAGGMRMPDASVVRCEQYDLLHRPNHPSGLAKRDKGRGGGCHALGVQISIARTGAGGGEREREGVSSDEPSAPSAPTTPSSLHTHHTLVRRLSSPDALPLASLQC